MYRHTQSGQAVVECLVVLGVLASLWIGAVWLGRLQDAALQASHASRHRAFALAHQGADGAMYQTAGVMVPGQGGSNRRGETFLDAGAARVSWSPTGRLPLVQPGDPIPAAAAVRTDLELGDPRVWVAGVHFETRGEAEPGLSLAVFDRLRLGLDRHTAIMHGSGAADGDPATQERIAQAHSVWGRYADASLAHGRRVADRMRPVDAAWGRAMPSFEWLLPWVGQVPALHLDRGTP